MVQCQATTQAGTRCKNKALYPIDNPISCGLPAHLKQLGVSKTNIKKSPQKIQIKEKTPPKTQIKEKTPPKIQIKKKISPEASTKTSKVSPPKVIIQPPKISPPKTIIKKTIPKKKKVEKKIQKGPTLDELRDDLMKHLDKYEILRSVINDLIIKGKKKYGVKAYTQISEYLINELTTIYQIQKPKLLETIGIILEMSGFSTISPIEKELLLNEIKPKVERTLDFLEKLINGSGKGGGQTLKDYETAELVAKMPEAPKTQLSTQQIPSSKQKIKRGTKVAVALEIKDK